MNYRHSFHAGNFADIVKHALLLWLLERRQAQGPVSVIDTHAGAIPDFDVAVDDDGVGETRDDVVPPLRVSRWVFEGDVVLG